MIYVILSVLAVAIACAVTIGLWHRTGGAITFTRELSELEERYDEAVTRARAAGARARENIKRNSDGWFR